MSDDETPQGRLNTLFSMRGETSLSIFDNCDDSLHEAFRVRCAKHLAAEAAE